MIPIAFKWLLIHEKAISTLYFITSPNWPVTCIFCLLLWYCMDSTVRTFPPMAVQANPLTTPIPPHNSCLYLLPRYSSTFSLLTVSFSPFLTIFLHILLIFLYNYLTPNSLEYLITSFIPSSLNSTNPSAAFSLIWIGMRWLVAIWNFSSRE